MPGCKRWRAISSAALNELGFITGLLGLQSEYVHCVVLAAMQRRLIKCLIFTLITPQLWQKGACWYYTLIEQLFTAFLQNKEQCYLCDKDSGCTLWERKRSGKKVQRRAKANVDTWGSKSVWLITSCSAQNGGERIARVFVWVYNMRARPSKRTSIIITA